MAEGVHVGITQVREFCSHTAPTGSSFLHSGGSCAYSVFASLNCVLYLLESSTNLKHPGVGPSVLCGPVPTPVLSAVLQLCLNPQAYSGGNTGLQVIGAVWEEMGVHSKGAARPEQFLGLEGAGLCESLHGEEVKESAGSRRQHQEMS